LTTVTDVVRECIRQKGRIYLSREEREERKEV
jgi:hypothetical protein